MLQLVLLALEVRETLRTGLLGKTLLVGSCVAFYWLEAVSRAGDVRIIDYGLARIRGEGKARVQGTPEYMAPEQARHGRANEATDIYNLGATMYRLVAWRLPPNATEAGSGV